MVQCYMINIAYITGVIEAEYKSQFEPHPYLYSHEQNQHWLKLVTLNLVAKLWKSTNIGCKIVVDGN